MLRKWQSRGFHKVGKVIMGLTYREDVADIRESPVEKRVQELKEYDANVPLVCYGDESSSRSKISFVL